MTIFFPDISSYEHGMAIQPGTVAVIAKATEGTYYRDADYATFKAQAAKVGAVFSAYHFLKAGDAAAQADYCYAMVGSTPVMLDVETEGASKPGVADCAAFIARMRQLGGRVWGAYFPQWYWQQVGGNLASLGVALVSSNYTAYSDSGPGWAPYGGATPAAWQYTDKQPYGGQTVDFNAFKGTVAQLAELINGTTTPTGEDMPLTQADADLVAKAVLAQVGATVYNYGRESIVENGKTVNNVPMGNYMHGTWKALYDSDGVAHQTLNGVTQLLGRPAPPTAAQITTAVQAAIQNAISAGLVTQEAGKQIAEQVVSDLTITVAAK